MLAVDLFYFGESKIRLHPDLFAIAVSSIGERPLGIEASQLAADRAVVAQEVRGAAPRSLSGAAEQSDRDGGRRPRSGANR